jgi:hypothetical protein
MRRRSLRIRVALNFAWFGALVSLMLSVGIYFAVHDLGQRLMYETLRAEMQDYQIRLARNPTAMLPATLTPERLRPRPPRRGRAARTDPPGTGRGKS